MSTIDALPAKPLGMASPGALGDWAGVPPPTLKASILDTVYEPESVQVMDGYRLLAAKHLATNAGIFVVNGLFGPEQLRIAASEAQEAGLSIHHLYVFAKATACGGNGVCVTLFEDLWPV